jgi:hypothetical protein
MARKGVGAGVVVTAATAGAIFAWLFRDAPQPSGVEVTPTGPLVIDLNAAWPQHVMVPGADGTGFADGADGVAYGDINRDGLPDFVVGYEQGLRASLSIHPGVALATSTAAWQANTVFLPSSGPNLCSAEDAILADVDNPPDGVLDMVVACETGAVRVTVFFAPSPPNDTLANFLTGGTWTRVDIAASTNNRSMRAVAANIAGDSGLEIVVGGKENSPCNGTTASIGYYSSPTPRNAASWAFTSLAPVGWVMNMFVRDVDKDGILDIVYSDRERIDCPALDNSKRGVRWLRGPSWTPTQISDLNGDHKWFDLADWDGDGDLDIADCRSSDTVNVAQLLINGGSFASWTAVPVTLPSGVGQCQHVTIIDLDKDGLLDLGYSFSNAASLSGLAWQKRAGLALAPQLNRGEVSGIESANDTKYDNHVWLDMDGDGDLDQVATEQHLPTGASRGLGLVFRANPLGPAAEVGGEPDAGAPPSERATVTCALLTSGATTTDAATAVTASVAPGANRALYAAMISATGAGPTAPTVNGAAMGLTWAQVASVTFSGGNRRLTVLRAMGASPSAGAITYDFAAQVQTSMAWSVIECQGVDTTGTNGSGATVQSVTASVSAATTLNATLAALEHPNNRALCMVGLDINSTVTPDADFVELSDNGVANGNSTLEAASAANQAACDPAFATANAGILSIEVKAGTL